MTMSEPEGRGLASADYILADYVEAHDELQRHEETGSERAVRRAAAALCRALVRLEDDDSFWRALAEVRRSPVAATARATLEDLDTLLGLERKVLQEAGVREDVAASIVQDVAREMEYYDHWPDEWSVRRMRDAVGVAG